MSLDKVINKFGGPASLLALGGAFLAIGHTAKHKKIVRIPLSLPTGIAATALTALLPLTLIIDRIVKPIINATKPRVPVLAKVISLILIPVKLVLIVPIAALSAALVPVVFIAAPIMILSGKGKHLINSN